MNKIKFVYDLIGAIKQKENIKGSFNMTGVKGNTKVFEMNNNFEKENTTEIFKSSFNQEISLNGKKLKRNFSAESKDLSPDEKNFHHLFMAHVHNGFHVHHHSDFHFHGGLGLNHENKLSKIKLLFGMLDDMEIEKNQESGYTLSLISDKISKDVKKLLFDIINNQAKEKNDNLHKNFSFENSSDEFHDFIKQLHESNNFKFQIKLSVNDKYEVRKSIMEIENPQSQMKLNINVNLV